MNTARPVRPLVREESDIRGHHSLLEAQANTDIFGGWGVRILGSRVW